jgi:hypothetical protein
MGTDFPNHRRHCGPGTQADGLLLFAQSDNASSGG